MPLFGNRLLEERKRLKLSQEEVAEGCGVTLRSQRNYEKCERSPDAAYLERLAAIGADVQYIVTGQRCGDGIGLAAVQQAVLTAVNLLSLEKKVDAAQLAAAVTKLLAAEVRSAAALDAPSERYEGSKQIFNCRVGDVAGRDIVRKGRKLSE